MSAPHRRFLVNVVANFGNFGANLVFGLWFTPFLIHSLGVAVYGLIPLANSLINYFSLIGVSISGSVGRFVTIDLAKDDSEGANRTFNTFLFGSLGLIAALLPVGIVLWFLSPVLLHPPPGQEFQFQLLVASLLACFLLAMLGSCFDSAIWATSRFDIRSMNETFASIVRVGGTVLLFLVLRPALWQVGVGSVLGALVSLGGTVWAWRRLTPVLRIRPGAFDRGRLPVLFHTSRWMFLIQIGTLLMANIELILINRMVGPAAGGLYAPLVLWASLLRGVLYQIAIVLTPSICGLHAREESERIRSVLAQAVKLMSLLVALPTGLLCGLGAPTLRAWLGPAFESMAPLVWFVLVPFTLEADVMVLGSVLLAQNRLRWLALGTCLGGLVSVVLGLSFTGILGLGVYGVAFASALGSLLRNLLILPVHVARVLSLPWYAYLKQVVLAPLCCLVLGAAGWALSGHLPGRSWGLLMLAATAIAVPYMAFTYLFALNPADRATMGKILRLPAALRR